MVTTHDNGPKPADWDPEPRCCPLADCWYCQQERATVPPNVTLGED